MFLVGSWLDLLSSVDREDLLKIFLIFVGKIMGLYWYNGRQITKETIELDISEPGLLYGATVFTTLRTAELSPLIIELHYQRLRSSIIDLGWIQPEWEQLQQGIAALTPKFPILRITIFPNGDRKSVV